MHQLSGLHFEDCVAKRLGALRWGCRRSAFLDKVVKADLVQTSISPDATSSVRQLGTQIAMQFAFALDDPFKLDRFINRCMAIRHRKGAPARIYVLPEYDGRNMGLLAASVCDAMRRNFGHTDPPHGFIYILTIDAQGRFKLHKNPFAFRKEMMNRYVRAMENVDDRRFGVVDVVNGSGFTIRYGEDQKQFVFCYYANVVKPFRERPKRRQKVSFLPIRRAIRGWRLATAAILED